MKNKSLITAALVATVGMALSAHRASAYSTGDLILGFSQSGQTNDYEVDLGAASTFINATSPIQLTISDTDLSNDFTSYTTSGSLFWGVVGQVGGSTPPPSNVNGAFGLPGKTVFATEVPADTAYTRLTAGNQSLMAGAIASLGSGFGDGSSTASTTSSLAAYSQLATDSNGYATLSNVSGEAFKEEPDSKFTANYSSTLDLYEMVYSGATGYPGTTSTLLGTLAFSGDPTLTFTPNAVPEPSTYVSLFLAAASMVFIARRRNAVRA